MTLALPLLLVTGCVSSSLVIGADTGAPSDSPDPDTDDSAEVLPGDTSDSDTDTEDTDDGYTDEEEDAIYAAFFDPSVIQAVEIELSQEGIRALNGGDDEYQHADVTINGTVFYDVGVRLKGSSTYMDLDCGDGYCKAGFKIKLNEFVEDQRYGDIERVTLNNMYTDYTQSKEVIVYDLLNQHSQLASRASYARVTLNGEAWGLYTNIESADERWLRRRFEDDEGEFWGTAASYGDFYGPYLDTGWVSKSGEGDMARIEALTAALDVYQGDFFGELGELVNVDQWLDYWGWTAAVGNYDGYPYTVNDVLIYEDPTDKGRFVFAPWGTDESWDEVQVSGRNWNVVGARLGYACLNDPACVAELKVHIGEAVDLYEATDVAGMAQAAWDLSETDVQTDPKRPYTADYVWYYRDYYEGVMPTYADYVRGQVGL